MKQKYMTMQSTLQKNNAASLIQSWIRQYMCRMKYISKKNSAIAIQSYARMRSNRVAYKKYRRSIVIIQSFIRMANKSSMLLTLYNAVARIKRSFNAYKSRQIKAMRKRASMKVCSCYRVIQLKKSLRCLRQNKHVYNQRQNAAVRIQTYYRRKACQSKFLAILKCCIQLQSIVRSYQLRVRQLKIERLCVKLQSFVRMVLTRKCFLSNEGRACRFSQRLEWHPKK